MKDQVLVTNAFAASPPEEAGFNVGPFAFLDQDSKFPGALLDMIISAGSQKYRLQK